jgi:hypothetical protein
MNLFRSGEHVQRWLAGRAPGATVGVGTLSALAHVWWADRLDPRWTPHTLEQNQALLEQVGLRGEFWRLG